MNSLIIYHSGPSKNSEKIAVVLAQTLHAQLRTTAEVQPADIDAMDLIGLGAGIYYGRHHRRLLECVERLPLDGKKVFMFSTSGAGIKAFMHAGLRRQLARKHAVIIGEFACKGFDDFGLLKLFGGINKGCPNEHECDSARAFALALERKTASRL